MSASAAPGLISVEEYLSDATYERAEWVDGRVLEVHREIAAATDQLRVKYEYNVFSDLLKLTIKPTERIVDRHALDEAAHPYIGVGMFRRQIRHADIVIDQ